MSNSLLPDWLTSSFRSAGSSSNVNSPRDKPQAGESKLKKNSYTRSQTAGDGIKKVSNSHSNVSHSAGGHKEDDETSSVSSMTSTQAAGGGRTKWAWHNHLPINGPLTLQAYMARLTTSEGTHTIHLPGAGYTIRYAYVSQRGYYPDTPNKLNQDQFVAIPSFGGDSDRAFFGVFDGHGEFGTECANFAKDRVSQHMSGQLSTGAPPDEAYHRAMLLANIQLHRLPGVDDVMSGTTAVTALISGKMLHVANVGDSRCVLAERRGDKVIARDMSIDHTPFRKDECKRVRAKGAKVLSLAQVEGFKPVVETDDWGKEEDNEGDPPRLWAPNSPYPGTAFTRSIGDSLAEKIGVFAEPEVMSIDLSTSSLHPYLILASDGVWEFLSSQEVVDLVGRHEDPYEACLSLVADSYRQWLLREKRTDDITAVIVQFQGLRKPKPLHPPLPPHLSPQAVSPHPHPHPQAIMVNNHPQEPSSVSTPTDDTNSYHPSSLISQSSPNLMNNHRPRALLSPLSTPREAAPHPGTQFALENLRLSLASPSEASMAFSSPSFSSPRPIIVHPSRNLTIQEPSTPSPGEFAFLSTALRGNFLFAGLGPERLKAVFSLFERKPVVKGDVILRQGEHGNYFFVVESGEFDVILRPPGSATSHLVHTYISLLPDGPVSSFGDLALLHSDKPRAFTVVAQTSGMIWSLHREPFQKLIRSRPPPALKDSIDDMLVTEEDKIAALAALKETEVFECLTPRQLRVLVSAMQPIQLSKDECVVKQGEDIVEFFLIVSGELSCRVVQNGADSKEVLRLRPGQHFGERALIGSQGKKVAAKSSIVVASEHSRLLKISSKAFTSALGATMGDLSISFEFWMGLMEAMAIAVTTRNARMTKLFDSGIPFSSLSTKGLLLSLDCSALMFMESPPCQAGVNDGPKEVVVAARLTSVMDATAMGKQAQVLRARAITRSLEPGPFIPSPIKTYKDETVLAEILSSPLPLCTLESILSPLAPLDEESAAFLAASIAIGLEQLHRSGVLYRGLSLDTVAVTEGGLAQLLDFRYARQDDGRAFTLCGSHPEFLAPEIILGRSPAESSDPTKSETGQSEAADAWAFGVVVSSMLNGGQTPFSSPGDDELRAYRKIVCLPPNLPSHISAPARDLLVALLQKEPSKRLGRALGLIEALMAHPWFSGIDWVALAEQRLPTPPGLKERLDAFEGVETAEFVPSPCPLPQAAWINEF